MIKHPIISLASSLAGISCFFLALNLRAQELFPANEPASTMPKSVVGVRVTTHAHYKYSTLGHREMIRLLYGAGAKVTVMLSASASNFHVSAFPQDLNGYFNNYHNHRATTTSYVHRVEGFHLYAKWRMFTRDEKNKHFRIALYGEASANKAIHLDAFPNLMGDHSGAGSGIILTKLNKRFAASLTGGYLEFFPYSANENNERVVFQAANATIANASFGYLIYPRAYRTYRDLNVNLYVEVNSRFYGSPVVSREGQFLNVEQFKYLRGGRFACIYPGMQFIINSKTRIDLVYEQPLYFSHGLEKFPMLIINVQKYFL